MTNRENELDLELKEANITISELQKEIGASKERMLELTTQNKMFKGLMERFMKEKDDAVKMFAEKLEINQKKYDESIKRFQESIGRELKDLKDTITHDKMTIEKFLERQDRDHQTIQQLHERIISMTGESKGKKKMKKIVEEEEDDDDDEMYLKARSSCRIFRSDGKTDRMNSKKGCPTPSRRVKIQLDGDNEQVKDFGDVLIEILQMNEIHADVYEKGADMENVKPDIILHLNGRSLTPLIDDDEVRGNMERLVMSTTTKSAVYCHLVPRMSAVYYKKFGKIRDQPKNDNFKSVLFSGEPSETYNDLYFPMDGFKVVQDLECFSVNMKELVSMISKIRGTFVEEEEEEEEEDQKKIRKKKKKKKVKIKDKGLKIYRKKTNNCRIFRNDGSNGYIRNQQQKQEAYEEIVSEIMVGDPIFFQLCLDEPNKENAQILVKNEKGEMDDFTYTFTPEEWSEERGVYFLKKGILLPKNGSYIVSVVSNPSFKIRLNCRARKRVKIRLDGDTQQVKDFGDVIAKKLDGIDADIYESRFEMGLVRPDIVLHLNGRSLTPLIDDSAVCNRMNELVESTTTRSAIYCHLVPRMGVANYFRQFGKIRDQPHNNNFRSVLFHGSVFPLETYDDLYFPMDGGLVVQDMVCFEEQMIELYGLINRVFNEVQRD